jgi:hypothetical protein
MNVFFIFFNAYVLNKIIDQKYYARGYDERYIYHPNDFNDNISIEEIIKQEMIQKDIDLLKSNNISSDDKLHFVNNNGIPSPIKITNGGLMIDFLFEFVDD